MQLSVQDAANLLNISTKTIYRWIKQEAIPVYRINEQFRFNRAELLEWATSRRIPISPEIFLEAEANKAALPGLADALRAGGIAYRVGGDDKPSVLRAVVDLLQLPEEVDREFLYQVLLARESLGSTGIGDGNCWCAHTQNVLGPDDKLVDRPRCSDTSRACYQAIL